MTLLSSLTNFVDIFQRSPANFGEISISSKPRKFEIDIPLGKTLQEYYSSINFTGKPQVGGRFLLFLFKPEELLGAQYGWRWEKTLNGSIVEDTKTWNAFWVVIGDRNGDALFIDTNSERIYGSIQKINFLIADTLAQFFDILAEGINIEMEKYDFEVLDDDMNLIPNFLKDVQLAASDKLSPEASEGFMKFFFG